MRHGAARWFCAVIVAASAAASGCGGSSSGYTYRHPPASAPRAAAVPVSDTSHQTIVVIGEFANPPRAAVGWRDIGSGMSETLVRSLQNRGDYDARIGARDWKQDSDIPAIRQAHPDASIFVTGSVTDFHQTGELAEPIARRGVFSRRSEAVVAVQLSIFDLESGRIILSDHVAGTADAGETPAKQLYKDLSFGSYLFWSTPLGRASDQALARVIECIGRAAPAADGAMSPRIIAVTGFRRVSIEGGRDRGLKVAGEFYLVRDSNGGTSPTLILDPVTGHPVRARIDSTGESTATAWLIGEPASTEQILGAALCAEAPATTVPAENDAAAATASTADP
jgi:curli biogenesis system outer membrane secretion channel CsgG